MKSLAILYLLFYLLSCQQKKQCQPDFFQKYGPVASMPQLQMEPMQVRTDDTCKCGYRIRFRFWEVPDSGNIRTILNGDLIRKGDTILYRQVGTQKFAPLFIFVVKQTGRRRYFNSPFFIGDTLLQIGLEEYLFHRPTNSMVYKHFIDKTGFLVDTETLYLLASPEMGIIGAYVSHRFEEYGEKEKSEAIITYIGDIMIFDISKKIKFDKFQGYY